MNFDITEHNLEKFYINHYIERLKTKWEISSDAFTHLYPFQIRGIQFLLRNFLKNQSCILDYDSEMGKTVIISVLLDNIMCTKRKFHSLIICEKHLISHWYQHIIKWSHFDPICIKNLIDIESIQLDDQVVCIVDYGLLKEIKMNSWNLIVIDNADKKSIINNNHVKKFKEICKSSIFILLTNAAVKQPSKKEILWYILHFLKADPAVPSLKKFTSENLYTLQDKLWFPWKDIYQRIGWHIYPEYKDITKKNDIIIVKKQPKILKKISTNDDITITADDTKLMQNNQELENNLTNLNETNNSTKTFENYFINENNEFLTPRCTELRKILKSCHIKSKIIKENNFEINFTVPLNNVHDNLEIVNINDEFENNNKTEKKINIRNKLDITDKKDESENKVNEVEIVNIPNTFKVINENDDVGKDIDNNTKIINFKNQLKTVSRNNQFENDFEQLLSLKKKPKNDSQQSINIIKRESEKNDSYVRNEKNEEDNLKSLQADEELSVSKNNKMNTKVVRISEPVQNKQNSKLNLLFDKLLFNEPIIGQSKIFKNEDNVTKTVVTESIEKRINTSDDGNNRKKLKTQSSSDNFVNIELESSKINSKQRKSNSFESMFENLISKRK